VGTVPIDGFIGPAHVSIVIGSQPYEHFAEEYRKPVVIAGFEPLDVMQGILMLVRQVNEGRAEVENEFSAPSRPRQPGRAGLVSQVFELRELRWRGLGEVPYSALKIRPAFAAWDAERKFALHYQRARPQAVRVRRHPARRQAPTDCKLFGTVCTPESPMGSCMVSNEGACAATTPTGASNIPVVSA
jgi:hydrogenase expression/formation protein HypD